MLEHAVDHVRHGLEAPMRVPRGTSRLTRSVVDLAHLVHVDERIEVGEVDAGESTADGKALAFESGRRSRDAAHGTDACVRASVGQSRNGREIVDRDGWHRESSEALSRVEHRPAGVPSRPLRGDVDAEFGGGTPHVIL